MNKKQEAMRDVEAYLAKRKAERAALTGDALKAAQDAEHKAIWCNSVYPINRRDQTISEALREWGII